MEVMAPVAGSSALTQNSPSASRWTKLTETAISHTLQRAADIARFDFRLPRRHDATCKVAGWPSTNRTRALASTHA